MVGCPLRFLGHSIDGITQQPHDGLAEHVGITVHEHSVVRYREDGLDAVLLLFLGKIAVEHLLVLLEYGAQVHVGITARAILQHLFHRLEHV